MREIDAKKRRSFNETFVGTTLEVLIESKRDKESGLAKGKSDNYIPVFADAANLGLEEIKGKIVKVRAEGFFGAGLMGRIV